MTPFDPIKSPITDGLTVIEASAGTGKTFSISHLVPRLLLERPDLEIREILLVTYTNDAAGELAERTRRVFRDLLEEQPANTPTMEKLRALMNGTQGGLEKIHTALRDLDLLNISTIHSFCQSVLQTEGDLCGLPVMPEVLSDSSELVHEALHDIWRTEIAADPRLSAMSKALDWSFDADRDFVEKALEMPALRLEPDPPPFQELLERLDSRATLFPDADISALREFLAGVEAWNTKGRSAEFRADVPAVLADQNDLAIWLDVIKWLAALDISEAGAIKKPRNSDPHSVAAKLNAVKTAKQILADLDLLTLSWRKLCARKVAEKLEAAFSENRLVTFDGMVALLDRALSGKSRTALLSKLRERFKIGLVDESQDTDPRQFRIFSDIFLDSPSRSLVLIGDPKQAIYGFRGADVGTYLSARNLEGARIYTLAETFRSPQPLVTATNALFERQSAFHKPGLDFFPSRSGLKSDTWLCDQPANTSGGARIEAWIAPDADAALYSNAENRLKTLAEAVASEIARLLSEGRLVTRDENGVEQSRSLQPSDFAVLAADRHQIEAVHEALKNRGIPAIRKSNEDVMATDEARELLILLLAVNEPLRAKSRRAALATRLLGKTDGDIRALEESDGESIVAKFQNWKLEWTRHGISALLGLVDGGEKVSCRLASSPDGERRLTNFRQLSDLIAGYAALSGSRPNRLLRWLEQEIARAASSKAPDERLLQLESDSLAVNITTMHSSKGLEYPLVFCPFLWSAKNPKHYEKLNRNGSPMLVDTELCEPSTLMEWEKASLEEQLRLAYVAITRAKVKAWICAGTFPGDKGAPSALDWLFRPDGVGDFKDWKTSAASNRGTTHLAAFQRISAPLDGLIKISTALPADKGHSYQGPAFDSGRFQTDFFTPPSGFWRTTSFSSLTREKHAKGESSPTEPARESSVGPAPFLFASIPGGAQLGTAVHDFLENWDFSTIPSPSDLENHFARFSLSKDGVPQAVAEMLAHLRAAILPGMNADIAQTCGTPRTSEWQFHLPVATGFGIDKIARAFREHGDPQYAESLEKLGSDPLEGFLQGFIDKIALHGSARGVIDWKTNTLPAYDSDSLCESARTSHYWLQTHLYLVALRRYFGPQADIRGAWLVYLRGIRAGTDAGILHVRPAQELLDALDKLFLDPAR